MHEICCKIPFDIFNLKLNLGNQRLKVSPTFTSLATIFLLNLRNMESEDSSLIYTYDFSSQINFCQERIKIVCNGKQKHFVGSSRC